MKKQIKIILMLTSVFIVLNVSCRKNDHPGSTCNQPTTGEYSADVQNEQAVKSGANVPAQWYALAIKLARTTPGQNI
ncbi:MAG: hypothetical protein ABI472_10095, partial [Ginsengibacter sp.]